MNLNTAPKKDRGGPKATATAHAHRQRAGPAERERKPRPVERELRRRVGVERPAWPVSRAPDRVHWWYCRGGGLQAVRLQARTQHHHRLQRVLHSHNRLERHSILPSPLPHSGNRVILRQLSDITPPYIAKGSAHVDLRWRGYSDRRQVAWLVVRTCTAIDPVFRRRPRSCPR